MINVFNLLFPLAISVIVTLAVRSLDKRESPIEKLKRYTEKSRADFDAQLQSRQDTLERLAVDLATKQSKTLAVLKNLEQRHTEFEGLRQQVEQRFTEIDAVKVDLNSYHTEFTALMDMTAQVEENLEKLKNESELITQVQKKLAAQQKTADDLAVKIPALDAEITRKNEERFAGVQAALIDRAEKAVSALESRVQAVHDRFASVTEKISGQVEAAAAQAKTRAEELERAFAAETALVYQGMLGEARTDAVNRIEMETRTMTENLSRQIAAARAEIEESLRKNHALAEERREELRNRYYDEMQSLKTALDIRLDGIRRNTMEIEAFTGELQSKTEKTQRVLDEFLAGAQNRIDESRTEFERWTVEQQKQQDNLKTLFTGRAEEMELNLVQMKSDLDDLQRRALSDASSNYQQFEESFLADLSKRGDNLESELARWKAGFDTRLSEKIDAGVHSLTEKIDAELEKRTSGVDGEITRFQAAVTARLTEALDAAAGESAGSREALEKTLAEFTAWKVNLDERFEDYRTQFSADMENFVQESRSAFAEAARQRDAVRSEAAQMDATVRAEAGALQDQVIADTKKLCDDVLVENAGRTAEQIAALGEKLQSTTAEFTILDAKLRKFSEQTVVIEQAEQQKAELEASIRRIQGDLQKVEEYRASIDDMHGAFDKLQGMQVETDRKLFKLSGDQKHLESLEHDFNRLLESAKTVEQRMAEIRSTNDSAQKIEVALRQLQNTADSASSRLDRLEQKKEVLEQTIFDADKSFEKLKSLEGRLKDCEQQTLQFPQQLDTIRHDMGRILNDRSKIADVVRQIDALDKTIAVLGQSMAQAEEKKNELIDRKDEFARLEIRLDQIAQDVDARINIIKNLERTGTGPRTSGKGAPPINIRESVIQLAHEGWKTDVIASRLNLTRSEVELILEMQQ